ncbi:MAG TPA: nitrilase-related carbon-nitrogen hydrolase [Candidatus Acidoferrales bacterium]|nr:nitrilase-related carbon-nitrogen hydrolase [Candidatus Acidoferrales bacterium]
MKVAIVQTKPRKGDFERNLSELGEVFAQLAADAERGTPDLIVLPEAALTGYFLEGAVYDLAMHSEEIAARIAAAWRTAAPHKRVDIAFGFYENDAGTYHNAAMYLTVDHRSHAIVHVHRKMFLPTYGVFDEERFLSRGRCLGAFDTRLGRMAILICEDMWHSIMPTLAAVKGAQILLVPSASPGRGLAGDGELESVEYWHQALRLHAAEHGVYIIYAGLAGFEGGKGMTGSSCIVNPRGERPFAAPVLGAHVLRGELDLAEVDLARANLPLLGDLRAVLPDLLTERR